MNTYPYLAMMNKHKDIHRDVINLLLYYVPTSRSVNSNTCQLKGPKHLLKFIANVRIIGQILLAPEVHETKELAELLENVRISGIRVNGC